MVMTALSVDTRDGLISRLMETPETIQETWDVRAIYALEREQVLQSMRETLQRPRRRQGRASCIHR